MEKKVPILPAVEEITCGQEKYILCSKSKSPVNDDDRDKQDQLDGRIESHDEICLVCEVARASEQLDRGTAQHPAALIDSRPIPGGARTLS
jgi:hypothetical protein